MYKDWRLTSLSLLILTHNTLHTRDKSAFFGPRVCKP